MDQMLTDTLHSPPILLSRTQTSPPSFMQNCSASLSSLREQRLHERIDGSLTSEKARKNRLEALVLRGMVEDGLREEMSAERTSALEAEERETARSLYDAHLQHFLRPAFNDDIQRRAIALLGDRDLSAFDKLQLRWAAVEARAAAHEAVEAVPLHKADAARGAAIALLHDMLGTTRPPSTVTDPPPQTTPGQQGEPALHGRSAEQTVGCRFYLCANLVRNGLRGVRHRRVCASYCRLACLDIDEDPIRARRIRSVELAKKDA